MEMPVSAPAEGRLSFGVFDFDPQTLELRKNGRPVALRPQALKLLALLVAAGGEVVARADIQRTLWSDDTFVDFDQGVNHVIRELRSALGDGADSPRFIQTLPRRGYRFLAPVASSAPLAPPSAVVVEPPRSASPQWGLSATRFVAGAAVLVAAAIVAFIALRPGIQPPPALARVLEVRPFETVGTDASAGAGLATAIASRLGGQQTITIMPPRAGTPADAPRPDVTQVLTGDLRQSGSAVTVLVRLADVSPERTVWSERIHLRADELFSVENVVAERVVDALRLRLAADEHDRLRRQPVVSPAAYEDYLRGRAALVKYTQADTKTAVEAFALALARDPEFAAARAGLAMACADMYLRFALANEADAWAERAESEARAALASNPDLAEAHLARAAVARKREFDWDATITASRRALVLNPSLDQAYLFMAAAYYHLGYMEEALIALANGRRLHGADAIEPLRIDALVALFSGKFAPAVARLEEVSRSSSQPIGDTYLALAYYYSGSAARSMRLLETLTTHPSASTSARARSVLAAVAAAQGRADVARRQLALVQEGAYRDHHVAYWLGAAYAQLGDAAEAARWLRIAVDTGFPCLPWFERDPLLEPLRRGGPYPALIAYVRTRRDTSLSSDHR